MAKKPPFYEFKDEVAEEVAKSKTKIGENAAERSYYKNVLDKAQTYEGKLEKVKSARDEADDEVKRETRGKVPGLKKGGSIDGCAIRGKTRASHK